MRQLSLRTCIFAALLALPAIAQNGRYPKLPTSSSDQTTTNAGATYKDGAGVDVSLVQLDDGHVFETEAARHRLAYETVKFFDRTLENSPK